MDKIVDQRIAEHRFREKVYKAKLHVLARSGTIEGLHEIDIHQLTSRLRFKSKNDSLTLGHGGRINGQQLQVLRELTPASADLLAVARKRKHAKGKTVTTAPAGGAERKRKPSSFANLKRAYDYALDTVGRSVIPAHYNYQVGLRRFLEARGVKPNMEENFVDVGFTLDGDHYIGEIKVTTYLTPQQAFRTAVGQVLEYAHLAFKRTPQMMIFLDHSPDERRVALAEKLGIAIVVKCGRKFSLLNPTSIRALSKVFGARAR